MKTALVCRFSRNFVTGARAPTSTNCLLVLMLIQFRASRFCFAWMRQKICGVSLGLKDKKSWSEPDLSALWCEKVWFKVVGGQL